ncbi:hypothetical protein C1G86_0249 [Dehalococcoides mccartyi]|uniref:Uncharacterized protein n=1 Tax=Dehalococcoides mccartyi TaxID=61435 RepID=A0A328EPI4_9CHLR|nr:hypothetical protein C1G87_0263 [Dehalococcoides mccartyi]RAL70652.1 hypothetical protein C1G86_0249 [Dehalococcoides mccartyi]
MTSLVAFSNSQMPVLFIIFYVLVNTYTQDYNVFNKNIEAEIACIVPNAVNK